MVAGGSELQYGAVIRGFNWPVFCITPEVPGKIFYPIPVFHNVTETQAQFNLQEEDIKYLPNFGYPILPLSLV